MTIMIRRQNIIWTGQTKCNQACNGFYYSTFLLLYDSSYK